MLTLGDLVVWIAIGLLCGDGFVRSVKHEAGRGKRYSHGRWLGTMVVLILLVGIGMEINNFLERPGIYKIFPPVFGVFLGICFTAHRMRKHNLWDAKVLDKDR